MIAPPPPFRIQSYITEIRDMGPAVVPRGFEPFFEPRLRPPFEAHFRDYAEVLVVGFLDELLSNKTFVLLSNSVVKVRYIKKIRGGYDQSSENYRAFVNFSAIPGVPPGGEIHNLPVNDLIQDRFTIEDKIWVRDEMDTLVLELLQTVARRITGVPRVELIRSKPTRQKRQSKPRRRHSTALIRRRKRTRSRN